MEKGLLNPLPVELNLFKFSHLALRLSYPEDRLKQIHLHRASKINSFLKKTIKKTGKVKEREIYAPIGEYKFLLKRINNRILNRVELPKGVCGAIIGKDLFDMISIHCGREAILKIDIENFFSNVLDRRVYPLLLRMKCSPEIAKFLTELMTYDKRLPQGFSTSPMISNIVSYKLDLEHLKICEPYNIERTRWLDDIVFSGRRTDLEIVAPKIITSVKKNGFRINNDKSRFSGRQNKMEIVGLLANKHKPYVSEKVIERVLSYIHIAIDAGYEKLSIAYPEEFQKQDIKNSLLGKVRHIQRFNKNQIYELENEISKLP